MYDPIYGEFEEHVKVGYEVWYCGDECDWPHIVKVGESRTAKRPPFAMSSEHCYEAVNTFWNRLYFNNEEDAKRKNFEARADYGAWLAGERQYYCDDADEDL